MGILTDILFGRSRANYLGGAGTSGILSPWAGPSHLEQIATSELLGYEPGRHTPLTRLEAMQIPAVAKGRNLIIAALAGLPLKAYGSNSSDALAEQPTWLYRTDSDRDEAQPYNRMAATIDDLLFFGHSLWLTSRSTATGLITEAAWTPTDSYEIRDSEVFPKGSDTPLNRSQYILFHTPLMPGLLTAGAVTLRGARDTERAWTARMETPIPMVEYRITSADHTDQETHERFAAEWYARHRAGEPALGITPPGAEIVAHGRQGEADLYLESRNAIRLDVAAFWGIPSALMDSSVAASSLTYVTNEGSRNRFYDECLPLYTGAIEAALSVDKCVPRGQRIRFDRTELYNTPTPTGAPVAD